jgi:hypothetical protein
MSTQATTAAGTIRTTTTLHEYRIEPVTVSRVHALLARLRRDRDALDRWQWQPVAPTRGLQEELLHAQLRMLAR